MEASPQLHHATGHDLGDLIDLGKKSYKRPFPMIEPFNIALEAMDRNWFEFVKVDGMVDDEIEDGDED